VRLCAGNTLPPRKAAETCEVPPSGSFTVSARGRGDAIRRL
jgi:hypothetical protein